LYRNVISYLLVFCGFIILCHPPPPPGDLSADTEPYRKMHIVLGVLSYCCCVVASSLYGEKLKIGFEIFQVFWDKGLT